MADLGSAYGEVVIDATPARKGTQEAAAHVRVLEGVVVGVSATMTRAMLDVGAKIARGLASVVTSSVKMSAQMEAQLDSIGSVMGTTEAETQKLKATITDLGLDPTLKVTAEEAAAAIEMLGRNGLRVEEIIDGAAKATVLLANATGADFATAANIATDAMALWGIAAKDMEAAVSGIAAVVTNSKWSINDYALGLAQAGGVAAAVGVPFEEFGVVLAGIAPLFSSGSDAGTSFKTMLQRLEPQSDKARAKMQELGLITADGANQFFTATGALKSMEEISGVLAGALDGLSEQQRLAALSVIFGTDAMRAAVGIAEMGADGYRDLADAMAETDAADMAARRMGNLAGSIEILGGVVDTTKLKLGDFLSPATNEAVKVLTDLLVDLNEQFDAEKVERWANALAQGVKLFLGGAENEMEAMIQGRIDASRSLEDYIALLQDLASMQGEIDVVDVWATNVMPDALAKIDKGLIQTAGSFDEYMAAVRRARDEMDLHITAGNGSYEAMMLHYEAVKKLIAEEDRRAQLEGDAAMRAEQAALRRRQAAGATDKLTESTEQLTQAEQEAAAAQAELNARIAAYFVDALGNLDKQASLGEMILEQAEAAGLSAQAIGELMTATGEMSQVEIDAAMARLEMAQITGELNALLEAGALTEEQVAAALQDEWNARKGVINAVYDQNEAEQLAEEQARELEKAEEELKRRLEEVAQAVDQKNRAFSQSFMDATADATVNLNQELMAQAQAAGASATELALLGLATGQFTEEQVRAALQAAIMREKINQLAIAYANGEMTAQQMIAAARNTRAELEEDFTATFNAEGIDGVIEKTDEFLGKVEQAIAEEHGVKVTADTTEADTNMADLETRLRGMEEVEAVEIPLSADTTEAEESLRNLPEEATLAAADAATGIEEGMDRGLGAAKSKADEMGEAVSGSMQRMAEEAALNASEVPAAVTASMTEGQSAAASKLAVFGTIGKQIPAGLASGVLSGNGTLSGAVTTIVYNAIAAAQAAAVIRSPSHRMMEIGEQMIAGLVVGLEQSEQKAVQAVAVGVENAILTAQQLLGIGSPSRVFYEIGESIVSGLVAALEDGEDEVEDAMAALLGFADTFSSVGSAAASAFQRLVAPKLEAQLDEFDKVIEGEQLALAELLARRDARTIWDDQFLSDTHLKALRDGNVEMARQVEEIWNTQETMAQGAAELAEALGWDRTWVDDQEKLLEAYRDALARGDKETAALIASFQDIQQAHRDARSDLAEMLGLGETDVTDPEALARRYAQAQLQGDTEVMRQIEAILEAQEKRNEAEAEYEAQLERINKLQEAQANLQYLQQQLDMLNMLAEYGLDAREVLGDIQLGAGADPLALVDAMTATLDAIAGRVNAQIGSMMGYPLPTGGPDALSAALTGSMVQAGDNSSIQTITIYGGLHLEDVSDAKSLFEQLAGLGMGSSL